MRSPLVSICIPTYNQTEYLRKCLQSVIEQDFIDYELIITDDTPDDSVKELVFTMLDGRDFKYIKNCPSLGSPANWNKAISEANGTYIKILHHDDYFTSSTSLGLMVEDIQLNNADFLFCETKVWYPATGLCRIHTLTEEQFRCLVGNIGSLLLCNLINAPSATLYRNDPVINYDDRLIWLVDVDYYIRYLNAHRKIRFLNKALVCRVHGIENQITGVVENDKNIQIREHVLLYLKLTDNLILNKEVKVLFMVLFDRFGVKSYRELLAIVPEASFNEKFYQQFFVKSTRLIFNIKKMSLLILNRFRQIV